MGPELPLLCVENLACERAGRRLLSNLSFELHSGDFFDLRGANGAGKSSLLRLLAGLGEKAEGDFTIREGFHYVGHQDSLKAVLTVRENLTFWADVQGGGNVDKALIAFSLKPLADERAALLSQGQKRRLALSRLALQSRGVWLLDEPTVGLDTQSLQQLRDLIAGHLNSGNVLLAATHADLGIAPRQTIMLGKP